MHRLPNGSLMDTPGAAFAACGSIPAVATGLYPPDCPACPFCADANQHSHCSSAGTCVNDACQCESGFTGTVCDIPESFCASGVLSEAGGCCEGGVVDVSGRCCGIGAHVDATGQCCPASLALDACGICGGSGRVVARDGECCTVRHATCVCVWMRSMLLEPKAPLRF